MNDSLSQLPEFDPRPDLWARIEADLNADEHLSRVVQALPEFAPKAGLWATIEQTLPTETQVNIRPLWQQPQTWQLWAGLAVAAMLVFVGSWLFLRPESTEKVRVEYAVEQSSINQKADSGAFSDESNADERAEEFINRQCAEDRYVCQRPEVHELRNQLTELTEEQQRIEEQQQVFGDDPALIRAQVKIENQRAEVTKELITLLRS
ncbi:hypothetical protein [Spirosoma luteum]|uniref:hypothetical protein n=1 Tax=Spirosoma luteum TaxID=431553 RepID=UPI00036EDE65|nr:hypothetical protein [Spirosoma luteum]